MAEEFKARDWRGGGQFITPAPQPPPAPAERLTIEAPPWSLAGEVAIDVTELAADDQPLARPKLPPPPWGEDGKTEP